MKFSHSKDSNCKGRYSKRNFVHAKQVVQAQAVIDEAAGPNNEVNVNLGISADENKRTKRHPHRKQCSEITETIFKDAKTTKTLPVGKQSSRQSERKGKKVPLKLGSKRYPLRSAHVGVRLLRSMSKEKNEKSNVPGCSAANEEIKPKKKKKKKRKKGKKAPSNEFSVIRKHVKYMLTRMNYEQNLLDAYSGEGWKGLSLDKLRPEKELERAKSEILRCKLRIRESFQQLDSLLSEGRFQESLFDSEGEIDSEDIFCAKCGLKDSSVDNDIILCDGICDRGFHQKCLNPTLPTSEIPLDDEGWLCPACDCKVDCLELLTDSQGIDITIEDTWENVFPEAAAIANGNNMCNNLDYPSDDSEDDDYNPDALDAPTVDAEDEPGDSSSDESDSTSLSDESTPLNDKVNIDISALPSDDSEDDDFDPNSSDPNKDIVKEESASDESDFTSDSDDFCDELFKKAKNVSVTSLLDVKQVDDCDKERNFEDSTGINSSVSGKRRREPLDFKKLNDEAFGKESSDSSDAEEWSAKAAAKKVRKNNREPASPLTPKAEALSAEYGRITRSSLKKFKDSGTEEKSNVDLLQVSQINGSTNRTPDKKTAVSIGNKCTTYKRRLSESVIQKLLDYFKEDQYPNRGTKERLAEELEITIKQIDKWFGNMRHSVKVSAKVAERLGISVNSSTKESKHRQTLKSAKTSDQPGTSTEVSAKGAKRKESQVSAEESDQPVTSVDVCSKAKHLENKTDDETPSTIKKRRNSNPSRQTAKNYSSNLANDGSNKEQNHQDGAGNGIPVLLDEKVKVEKERQKVDKERQKAVARELRRRRISR